MFILLQNCKVASSCSVSHCFLEALTCSGGQHSFYFISLLLKYPVSGLFHHFWGVMNKNILTPDKAPLTYKSEDTIKFQLGEPLNFIVITYKSMGEGPLQVQK